MIDKLRECRMMMDKIIAELDKVDRRLTQLERMTVEPPKVDWVKPPKPDWVKLQEVSRHAQD